MSDKFFMMVSWVLCIMYACSAHQAGDPQATGIFLMLSFVVQNQIAIYKAVQK